MNQRPQIMLIERNFYASHAPEEAANHLQNGVEGAATVFSGVRVADDAKTRCPFVFFCLFVFILAHSETTCSTALLCEAGGSGVWWLFFILRGFFIRQNKCVRN